MTDTEILDYIEARLKPANTGGPATASVKLASEIYKGYDGSLRYRFGGGPWRATLRAAVEEYARRNPR